MAVRYHAIAKTGTYTAKDGTEKTSWTRWNLEPAESDDRFIN